MQRRLSMSLAFTLAGTLTLGCGKSSSHKNADEKPKKPTLTTPEIIPGDSSVTKPIVDEGQPPKETPVTKPDDTTVTPPVVKPEEPPVTPPVVNNPPVQTSHALTGLWALSIAQKPRSCSSFYDLRDPLAVTLHILCPSASGSTISLQTETFNRTSDDGKKATWKRKTSTCAASANSAGVVFVSYQLDAQNNLVVSEGVKASPAMIPLQESNLAGDLKTATTLHGRPIVRGCFKSGNLETFIASGAAR